MKRILFALTILLSSPMLSAQNTVAGDSVSITPLQGVFGGFGLVSQGAQGIKTTLNVGYVNELKLGRTTSLTLSGSVLNSLYAIYTSTPFSYPDGYGYGLQLSLGVQPRVYVNDYAGRFATTQTNLNSGWYISLPVEINTSILTSTYPFSPSLFVGAAVGYRYAASRNLILEFNGGLGETWFNFAYLQTTPYMNLKACYIL